MKPKQLDPDHVFTCSGCGNSIKDGHIYYDIMGEQYCGKCVLKAAKTAKKEVNKEEK